MITVWDPGTDKQKSDISIVSRQQTKVPTQNHHNSESADFCPTKDIVKCVRKLKTMSSFSIKRSSPQKSHDSGFSDSSESDTSSASVSTSDNKPHITRVYLSSDQADNSNISDYKDGDFSDYCYQNESSHLDLDKQRNSNESFKEKNCIVVHDLNFVNKNKTKQNSNTTAITDSCLNKKQIKPFKTVICNDNNQTNETIKFQNEKGTGGDQIVTPFQTNVPFLLRDDTQNMCLTKSNLEISSVSDLLHEFRNECLESNSDTVSSVMTSTSISLPSSPKLSEYSNSLLSTRGSRSSLNSDCLPPSPVDHWMSELPYLCASECSVMLQSKSLRKGHRKWRHPTFEVFQEVKKIQDQSRIVSKSFADLCRNLGENSSQEILPTTINNLEKEVQEFLCLCSPSGAFGTDLDQFIDDIRDLPGLKIKSEQTFSTGHIDNPGRCHSDQMAREQQKLLNLLDNIKLSINQFKQNQLTEMIETVTKFGCCITNLVEIMLSEKVEIFVNSIKKHHSITELEVAIGNLTSLGMEGNHLCRLIARHGGVGLLVQLLTNSKFYSLKGAILRSLGTICCVLDSIRQLEEVKGVEVIARVLGEFGAKETERAEAAGVLAQITSPWIEDNDYILGVAENAFFLVQTLTELCRATKCSETFLLGSAALANLSFLSPLVLTAMSQMDTVSVLLNFLSHNVQPSIYIQDQVATVLANMAARQDTRDLLLQCNLVHALLYLLAASPTNSQELAVMSATQRVQQKAAIAIGRLCEEEAVVEGVLSGSGLERLVELSVCKRARLDSDSTLVAVITTVRKIASCREIQKHLENLGASELLNLCLIKSFKLFSHKHESFV